MKKGNREKIAETILDVGFVKKAGFQIGDCRYVADQILPLLEEAKREERERIRTDLLPLMAEAIDISDWSFVQEYVQGLKEIQ